MEWKTKEVAEKLGINPRTMLSWIKYFNIQISKNDVGHYVYGEEDIAVLSEIKKQVDNGTTLSEVSCVKWEESPKETTVSASFDELMHRMNHLERMVQQKADEVVTVQLLNHRKELELITERLQKMEEIIESLKNKNVVEEKIVKPTKKNWFRFHRLKESH